LEADLTHVGLYQFLSAHGGYKTHRAKSFVEAVGASELEAKLLAIAVGAPLLRIESTVYLADGHPIDYFNARHRGDRLRLIIESQGMEIDHIASKRSIFSGPNGLG
jgi:GntR family transcriptional regulator